MLPPQRDTLVSLSCHPVVENHLLCIYASMHRTCASTMTHRHRGQGGQPSHRQHPRLAAGPVPGHRPVAQAPHGRCARNGRCHPRGPHSVHQSGHAHRRRPSQAGGSHHGGVLSAAWRSEKVCICFQTRRGNETSLPTTMYTQPHVQTATTTTHHENTHPQRRRGLLPSTPPGFKAGEPLLISNHATGIDTSVQRPPTAAGDRLPGWVLPLAVLLAGGDAASYLIDPALPLLAAGTAAAVVGTSVVGS